MSAVTDTSPALADLISLSGRNAVVTGAGRGIGFAIAARIAEAGANVVLADIAGADEAAARITIGGTASGARLDVTDSASVKQVVTAARETLGSIDIWVNCAGVYPYEPLADITDESWDRVLDINLRGSFIAAREAGTVMVDQGRGGVIVNVASTMSLIAHAAGYAHYVASKHGLLGLTRSLALELGSAGIRAVAICPTITYSDGYIEGCKAAGVPVEPPAAELARHPLGRLAEPDDVARVALFAVSDLASLVSGIAIPVDAGLLTT